MMKQGQTKFSGTQRFNTFGKNQNMLFYTIKSGKLAQECIVLENLNDKYSYYKDIPFNKNLLLSDRITVLTDGNIKVGK